MAPHCIAHTALAAINRGRWHPGIGDPTIFGWAIAIGYLVAAMLCLRAAVRERAISTQPDARVRPSFWYILSVLMLALGINKQLDLQTLLTQIGRDMARAQGWYAIHRTVQGYFILAVVAAGTASLAVTTWFIRSTWRRHALAMLGVVFLVCFILIRAASFHHIDDWLGWRLLHNLKLHAVLEAGGILTICGGAVVAIRYTIARA